MTVMRYDWEEGWLILDAALLGVTAQAVHEDTGFDMFGDETEPLAMTPPSAGETDAAEKAGAGETPGGTGLRLGS